MSLFEGLKQFWLKPRARPLAPEAKGIADPASFPGPKALLQKFLGLSTRELPEKNPPKTQVVKKLEAQDPEIKAFLDDFLKD
ncbi:MAG: hypothetical protein HYU97_07585 [Deltaproteobacteria bacterium]|nr:hypothetical protein [Deltaproteobacteria bacterium]